MSLIKRLDSAKNSLKIFLLSTFFNDTYREYSILKANNSQQINNDILQQQINELHMEKQKFSIEITSLNSEIQCLNNENQRLNNENQCLNNENTRLQRMNSFLLSFEKAILNHDIKYLEGYTFGDLHELIENPEKSNNDVYKSIMHQLSQLNISKKNNTGDKIKVAFIPSRVELWACDRLYRLLDDDDRFEPYIILTRTELYGDDDITDTYQLFYSFFKKKGYKCIEAYDVVTNSYKELSELMNPDIIVHLMPHKERLPEQYWILNMPLTYLNVYIPYGIMSANYHQAQFNQAFHHLCWKIFCETPVHVELAEKYSAIGSTNVRCSGYIKMDTFFEAPSLGDEFKLWKIMEDMDTKHVRKIIWAPHHWFSNNSELSFATFEKNYEFMYNYAKSHPNTSWILKPHPLLKVNGIRFGVFKSNNEYDQYMDAWDKLPNARVVEKDVYFDIFKSSDAMILDSVSFLAEYLYVNKPMLRLSKPLSCDPFNEFGNIISTAFYEVSGDDFDGISDFIEHVVVEGNDYLREKRKEIFDEYLNYPKRNNGLLASDYVYEYIKNAFHL